jgi:hypothetical protein
LPPTSQPEEQKWQSKKSGYDIPDFFIFQNLIPPKTKVFSRLNLITRELLEEKK